MAFYPTSTPSDAGLYVAFDNFSTTLNGAIDNVQTTITLTSTVGLPTVGILTIESEKVHYTGISGSDITGVTRGFSSTSAAAHADTTFVAFNVVEEHHNANKDEIIAVATDLRSTFIADLDDTIAPALTAASLSERLNHLATQIKAINTGVDWKDAIAIPLTGLVALDGSRTFTANQPLGGFKLTGLGAGTTAGDSVRYEDVDRLADAQTISGQKTFSAATLHADGTAALPGIAFSSDPDTGIFKSATDRIGFATAGALRWEITASGIFRTDGVSPNAVFQAADGTVTLPAYSFFNDSDTGIYRVGANQIGFTAGGVLQWQIDSAGNLTGTTGRINTSSGTAAAPAYTFFGDENTGIYRISADTIGISTAGVLKITVDSGGTTTFVEGIRGKDGSAAAPAYTFSSDVDTGIYRSGANEFRVATGGTDGLRITGTLFTVLASGIQVANFASTAVTIENGIPLVPSVAANNDLGTASLYWDEVNYKTLTDRGCLPWCDDGVELRDGSRVSDLEALCAIQKHPTEVTVHGLPKLDYRTFPKKSYRPADKDDVLLPRDENDAPIGGADGVEMTMLFGVMIGAFKQIKAENEALKARLDALEAE